MFRLCLQLLGAEFFFVVVMEVFPYSHLEFFFHLAAGSSGLLCAPSPRASKRIIGADK